jgi:integrase
MVVAVPLVEMVSKHMAARGLTPVRPGCVLFTALLQLAAPGLVPGDDGHRSRGAHDRRADRPHATVLVAAGVDIKTAQALLGHSNAQLTLGLYVQAVVSLGAAAAESMAARFQLPGPTRDRRAMEAGSEESEESDNDDA